MTIIGTFSCGEQSEKTDEARDLRLEIVDADGTIIHEEIFNHPTIPANKKGIDWPFKGTYLVPPGIYAVSVYSDHPGATEVENGVIRPLYGSHRRVSNVAIR